MEADGPLIQTGVLNRRGKRHTGRVMMESETGIMQLQLRRLKDCQCLWKWEEAWDGFLLQVSEGTRPHQHLDFGLLASRTVRQWRSVSSQELVGITLLGIDTGLYTMQGVDAGHLASGPLDTQINAEQNTAPVDPLSLVFPVCLPCLGFRYCLGGRDLWSLHLIHQVYKLPWLWLILRALRRGVRLPHSLF